MDFCWDMKGCFPCYEGKNTRDYFAFLGSALPLYMECNVGGWFSADYTKVNTTSTEARLAPGSYTLYSAVQTAVDVYALPSATLG